MFDYDPSPDIPTYIYECKICERDVKSSYIIKCDICQRRICKECNIGGFCIDHFSKLSQKGKIIFNNIKHNHEEKVKKGKILVISIFLALFLAQLLFFFLYLSTESYNILILMTCMIFIVILTPIVIFILYFKWAENDYLEKKLEVYLKYKQIDTDIK